VASLYTKVISGKPYWYLREMAWVEGIWRSGTWPPDGAS
jgi:hypothetical protein